MNSLDKKRSPVSCLRKGQGLRVEVGKARFFFLKKGA
jgi:hypothetical protein